MKTCRECGYTGDEKYCPLCRQEGRVLLLAEQPPPPPARALVLRITGLGDVIMSSVLCRYYHEQGIPTTLGTQKKYVPLMRLCPDVDEVQEMSYVDPEYPIQWDLDIKSPYQFDFHPLSKRMDRIDLILQLCGNVPLVDRTPRLVPTEHDREMAHGIWRLHQWEQPVVGLSLVSESSLRTIPVKQWPALFPFLEQIFPGHHFISFGDNPKTEPELAALGLPLTHFCNLPLRLVAAMLANCSAVIAVDSGLMHLAGAMGVPTVGIFGKEVSSRLRALHYPSIVPLDLPDLRAMQGNELGAQLREVVSRLPHQTLPDPTLHRESHAQVAPRFWEKESRENFYRTRPASEFENQEDRTHSDNYEYPRVRWIQGHTLGPQVLDVGTAGGQITRWYVEQGYITDICEPNAEWAAKARNFLNGQVWECFVEGLLEQEGLVDRWDTVIMADVLEHLEDPYAVVAGIVSRWRPQRLLITTPIGTWESDEHLWEFTAETITRLTVPLEGQVHIIRDRNDKPRWFGVRIDKPGVRKRGER